MEINIGKILTQAIPNLEALEETLTNKPGTIFPTRLRPRAIVDDRDGATAPMADPVAERARLLEGARSAINNIRKNGPDTPLSPDEKEGAEALVAIVGRPPLLIQGGKFEKPPDTWKILSDRRTMIEGTFPSVGRIELEGHPKMTRAGTGFLAASDVIATNRHVAKVFCEQGADGEWSIMPGVTASIDFLQEYEGTTSSDFVLSEVIGVHDTFDLAFFRVAHTSRQGKALPQPLAIEANGRDVAIGRLVYVVSYPAYDYWNPDLSMMRRLFSEAFEVKRLQPGMVMAVLARESLLLHDCSTLGGSSGAPVIDLETHRVIGVHYYGEHLVANRAMALWKLREDTLLQRARLNFASF